MVGGLHDHDVARARPLLGIMGKRSIHFGKSGSGQAAKACHNMICGITMLGVCETFALAESLDPSSDKFLELCRGAELDSGQPLSGIGIGSRGTGNPWLRSGICHTADGQGSFSRPARDIDLWADKPLRCQGRPAFTRFAASGHGDLDISAHPYWFEDEVMSGLQAGVAGIVEGRGRRRRGAVT